MNKTNVTVASIKGTSTLVRPVFGPGMLLQHEDLELLNSYTSDLSRLLFKSFFGCGVICGLVVKIDSKCGKVCLTVGAGVALACSGDPVAVPKDQTFALDENCDPNIESPLWVVLCGTTKQCAPRTSMCASDDDEAPSVPTRERDGFEIRVVRKRPDCACGCPDPKTINEVRVGETNCKCVEPYQPNDPGQNCYDGHYDGKCGCNCDECSDCDCKCILLAQLVKNENDIEHPWYADHRVRRFIRPVLMRDPQVELEEQARNNAEEEQQYAVILEEVVNERDEAYMLADEATKATDRAVVKANTAATLKEQKKADAQALTLQLEEAQAEADETAAVAKEAAEGLAEAKGLEGKTVRSKTPAVNKAQAVADKTADLAKEATERLAKVKAEAKKAAAEADKAELEARKAELEARKAEENKANAYRIAAAAAEKAARLMKE